MALLGRDPNEEQRSKVVSALPGYLVKVRETAQLSTDETYAILQELVEEGIVGFENYRYYLIGSLVQE